jgi:hypothetical protein
MQVAIMHANLSKTTHKMRKNSLENISENQKYQIFYNKIGVQTMCRRLEKTA